jgi:hypothetical protein
MMIAIYDRQGKTVAWLHDNAIVDRANQCRAFIREGCVMSYHGTYLGEFADEFFWDRSGYAIAFVQGARRGPTTPITEIPPIPPIPPILPIPPMPPISPIPPPHLTSWSAMGFDDFLSQ